MEQPGESPIESFLLDSAARGRRPRRWPRRVVPALLLAVVLLGWFWSLEPAPLQVAALPALDGRQTLVTGIATTRMLQASVQTLLDKPGGYLGNDLLPPGVWLDNMAAWERGAMSASRDLVRAMRRDFTHAPDVALEDADLLRAEPRLFFSGSDWLTTEDEYRRGIFALDSYAQRLDSLPPTAQFHARADSLARWLQDVEARLDAHVAALGAATAAGDARTHWRLIDDNFYEARGYAWALRGQQEAIAADFAPVIKEAGAEGLQQLVMTELDGTQKPVRSPLVMNGSEYGVVANHSLVMAGYLARTRMAVQQMRERLGTR
jgi:hypothetical protein